MPGCRAARAEQPRAHAVVFPALRRAPARGRRDRAVRSQLVQPRGRRARDEFLHRRGVRRILPLGARVREDARAQRNPDRQVLVLDHRRGTGSPVPEPHRGSAQAMEAEPDGPREPAPLGGVHGGEGGDAAAHAHCRGAVVGRAGGRQEARAAELHPSSAGPRALLRDRARFGASAAARTSRRLHPAPGAGRDDRAGDLLTARRGARGARGRARRDAGAPSGRRRRARASIVLGRDAEQIEERVAEIHGRGRQHFADTVRRAADRRQQAERQRIADRLRAFAGDLDQIAERVEEAASVVVAARDVGDFLRAEFLHLGSPEESSDLKRPD
ncbi:polyphosphate kinase 2 family protein [Burkholderia pseudomallei]|nr:polyphosphate kinase 2 family protein [Burkholderia pseudomallei]